RRAANQQGTSWQEVRFKVAKGANWVWTFSAPRWNIASFRFNTSNGTGGSTQDFGSNQQLNRVNTNETQAQGYLWGWSYGTQIAGSNSATSYLWSKTNGAGSARPFTQMWIRPMLRTSDFALTPIPDSGTPESTQRPLANSDAERTRWGVVGHANGVNNEL